VLERYAHDASQQQMRTLSQCGRTARMLSIPEPLPGDLAGFRVYGQAMESPEAKAIIDPWRHCLAAKGVVPPRTPHSIWVPAQVESELDQAHHALAVDVAIKDVRCKTRIRLVPRLARIEARDEQRWIEQHRGELTAQRRMIERVLARAEKVIEKGGS
jgi:hypothetical protein